MDDADAAVAAAPGAPQDRAASPPGRLPAPLGVRARPGRGQVTVSWDLVPGAVAYQVYRAAAADGPFEPVGPAGGQPRLAVSPTHTDTTATPDREYFYAVAPLARPGDQPGPRSAPAAATPVGTGAGRARVGVGVDAPLGVLPRPWRWMVGAGRLAELAGVGDGPGPGHDPGHDLGNDLVRALRLAHHQLGVATVRVPAVLDDALGVCVRDPAGHLAHDFRGVNRILDQVLAAGMRPVLELAYVPAALASEPVRTIHAYGAAVTPPADWLRWHKLIVDLTQHLVERYGAAEVRSRWAFQVWHDGDLRTCWEGSTEDYLRLYEVTAHAVKTTDRTLRVGLAASLAGSAAADLVAATDRAGLPLDFLAAHGAPLFDPRPWCAALGRPQLGVMWTERGYAPQRDADGPLAATRLLARMRAAAGRIGAMSAGPLVDPVAETGVPPTLCHGGAGLMTVGNLRKPRFWALAMAERLGDTELSVAVDGDGGGGAGALVTALAARRPDGTIGVLVSNGAPDVDADAETATGDLLARDVSVELYGVPGEAYWLQHWRVDADHSHIAAVWRRVGKGAGWPDEDQWHQLRERDVLENYEPPRVVTARDGTIACEFPLPMPAVSYLEFTPANQPQPQPVPPPGPRIA